MRDGGVTATVKHFPGLGRVHANTDIAANVTDRVTTRRDPTCARSGPRSATASRW